MVRMGEGSILFLGATVRIHSSPVGEPAGRKVFEAGNELQTLKCPPLLHHGQTQVCKVEASYGERPELGKDGEHILWSPGTPRTTCFKNKHPQ